MIDKSKGRIIFNNWIFVYFYLKSARVFRYESFKGVPVLKSTVKEHRRRSYSYGEKLQASTFNNGSTLEVVVEKLLRI